MQLHPTLACERLEAVREAWLRKGNLRIEPFLAEPDADALGGANISATARRGQSPFQRVAAWSSDLRGARSFFQRYR
jgi:hypothetical protein